MMSLNMEKSVQQGVNFLTQEKPEVIVYNLIEGGWNFARPAAESAKSLEYAIDKGINHSGSSFGLALKSVFAKAQEELGYHLTMSRPDSHGNITATLALNR